MITVGIRSAPKEVRIAIVEHNSSTFTLLNNSPEDTRWCFPANLNDFDERVQWFYRELEQMLIAYPNIQRVSVKLDEFVGSDTKFKRFNSYIAASAMLFARNNMIDFQTHNYSGMKTNSSSVKSNAAQFVGALNKLWDGKIADAIVVACQ